MSAAELDFFFDPVCPWAWITSRWVCEVQSQRHTAVNWRFICLKMVNADMDYSAMPEGYAEIHMAGLRALRVAAHARAKAGNDAAGAVYTMFGTSFHNRAERVEFVTDPEAEAARLLADAGLPTEWASAVHDESYDAVIKEETDLALSRTGKDVGTPIITFNPGKDNEGSFFGPVISSIPRGADAVQLWEAVEVIATTSGVAELKRSLRARPSFD